MCSLTATTTIQPANYLTAIEDLSEILEKYSGYSDLLSKSLSKWGISVLQKATGSSFETHDKIIAIAREELGVLANGILINPLNGALLQEPVLEREWTWELSLHVDCRDLFQKVSPFDQQMMSLEPSSHLFAKEMIHWMHEIIHSEPEEAAGSSSFNLGSREIVLLDRSASTKLRKFFYERLAKAAVAQAEQKKLREQMDSALVRVDQFMEEMALKDQMIIANAESKAAEHEAALQDQIQMLRRSHEETIDGLNRQINSLTDEHHQNIAALEARIGTMNQANRSDIDSLRVQISHANLEHQNATTTLRQEIATITREHQQTIANMLAQLSSSDQLHEEAMASILETHSRDVAGLTAHIKQTEKKANESAALFYTARDLTYKNKSEIDQLLHNLELQKIEISRLKDKIDDACIMV